MHTVSCRCGNLRATGSKVPANSFPNLQCPRSQDRELLSECKDIYLFRGKAIEIKDADSIFSLNFGQMCADITCCSCQMTLRFFQGQTLTVYGGIVQSRMSILDQCPAQCTGVSAAASLPITSMKMMGLPKTYPSFLQSFTVTLMHPMTRRFSSQLPQNLDYPTLSSPANFMVEGEMDGDFDLMFSNKTDPVVGSYRPTIGNSDPFLEAGISEVPPSSCYA